MDTPPEHPRRPRRAVRRAALLATSMMLLAGLAGCADFSREQSTFTVQPSLTQPEARPSEPDPASPSPSTDPSSSSPPPSGSPTGPTLPPDPCVPTDPAVIAACLAAPWGLVVLPDAQSALVGERTTGRVLLIAPKKKPVEFATVPGIDTANGGGLLGIALSPAFGEDGLVYAFITTKTDSRIVRFAEGQKPKAIFTGIPRGYHPCGWSDRLRRGRPALRRYRGRRVAGRGEEPEVAGRQGSPARRIRQAGQGQPGQVRRVRQRLHRCLRNVLPTGRLYRRTGPSHLQRCAAGGRERPELRETRRRRRGLDLEALRRRCRGLRHRRRPAGQHLAGQASRWSASR